MTTISHNIVEVYPVCQQGEGEIFKAAMPCYSAFVLSNMTILMLRYVWETALYCLTNHPVGFGGNLLLVQSINSFICIMLTFLFFR